MGNDFLVDFLLSIKHKGYCKNFGVCNYNELELVKIQKMITGRHVASNQIEFNLLTCSLFNREKIKNNPHLTIAYGVLNQGRLAASEKQRAALQLLAAKLNVSIETLVLAWALSYDNLLPLMKVSTLTHLKPLLQAFNVKLSEQDIMSIEEYSLNNIAYINLSDINLLSDGHRSPYLLEAEARENIQNLFPSPSSLAKRFIDGNVVLPLKVNQEKDGTYTVDPYDPIGQSKIFWGWKLAFPNSRIPAHILNT